MEYIDHYNYFYSKYISKSEVLIKNNFLKFKIKKYRFEWALQNIKSYAEKDHKPKFKNEPFENFNKFFITKKAIYDFENQIEEILKNEYEQHFYAANLALETQYDYIKLIKETAVNEAYNEVLRLLSTNSQLYEMMYNLNDFSEFKLIDYSPISLEDTNIFKLLHCKIYPQIDEVDSIEIDNIDENKLNTTQKVLLIEMLITGGTWNDISERSKSKLISKIIERNDTNIRAILSKSAQPLSKNTDGFKSDCYNIQSLINLLA